MSTEGIKRQALVQCKRWNVYDIGIAQASEFYGHVADIRHASPNTSLYFATTGFITGKAREFFQQKDITYIDFDVLMETRDYISLEGFQFFLNGHAKELSLAKKDRDQTQIFIDTNRDVFALLSKIRSSLAKEHHIPAYAIAKNQQLCEIIRHRPRSLGELSRVGGLSHEAVTKYGPQIILALRSLDT